MNRHQRQMNPGASLHVHGDLSLRYGGRTLLAEVQLAYPRDTETARVQEQAGSAAVLLHETARGPDKHMALVGANILTQPDRHLVTITCILNSPEAISALRGRVEGYVAAHKASIPFVHASVGEVEKAEALPAWRALGAAYLQVPTAAPEPGLSDPSMPSDVPPQSPLPPD
jgi:hypothetical protein